MNYNTLILEKKENYVILKLNRPDKLNALNNELFTELNLAFDALKEDESVKAVIVTGTGEKAFAAGADITELTVCGVESGTKFSDYGSKIFRKIELMNKPVIAAVNGFSLGGGCELAMACHIRFASQNAKFGQPEVNLGIIPGYGGTQRLTRLVGFAKATELIISGNLIDAGEAKRIGLVNEVFELSDLMTKTEDFVKLVLSKGSIAVMNSIRAIRDGLDLNLDDALNLESVIFGETCGSSDFKEGTSAFIEKRKANFTGK